MPTTSLPGACAGPKRSPPRRDDVIERSSRSPLSRRWYTRPCTTHPHPRTVAPLARLILSLIKKVVGGVLVTCEKRAQPTTHSALSRRTPERAAPLSLSLSRERDKALCEDARSRWKKEKKHPAATFSRGSQRRSQRPRNKTRPELAKVKVRFMKAVSTTGTCTHARAFFQIRPTRPLVRSPHSDLGPFFDFEFSLFK